MGTSFGFLLFFAGKPDTRSPEWLRVLRFEVYCAFFRRKFGSKQAFGCEKGTFPQIRLAGLGGEGDESEETEITSTESSWLSLSSFYFKRDRDINTKINSSGWRVKRGWIFTSESASPTWDSSTSDGSAVAALPLPLVFFEGGLTFFMAGLLGFLALNLSPFWNSICYKNHNTNEA